ncbi:RsmE family RNA methyltransferase [Timonella sp. A28]|uniref:RsmE family RNA methyltransferase n=1 Tax=Timonella sp. A28 TaxID=3442640 RepID=UPI003EBFF694
MSAPVFLAESQDLSHYVAGQFFELDGEEGRHAGVVQRRQVGEALDVVDGAGHRLRCVISSVNQSHLVLEIRESVQEAHDPYEFVLVQALAKGDRDELAIEAATEVGVDGVVPWQADRSIVIWRGARAAKSLARWAATVRSATKQARRARIPFVEQPQDSKRLAQWTREVVQQGGVVIVLHEEATTAVGKIELSCATFERCCCACCFDCGPRRRND